MDQVGRAALNAKSSLGGVPLAAMPGFAPRASASISRPALAFLDAAVRLAISGRYGYRKHLDRAVQDANLQVTAAAQVALEFSSTIVPSGAVKSHLLLVEERFSFGDEVSSGMAPTQAQREVLSSLYEEANQSGLTTEYWGANPELDQWIAVTGKELAQMLHEPIARAKSEHALHVPLVLGSFIRPMAVELLKGTFPPESHVLREEGSVGAAALDIARAVTYSALHELNLLPPDHLSAEKLLAELNDLRIVTSRVQSEEFHSVYRYFLEALSFVKDDLRLMLLDWNVLLRMSQWTTLAEQLPREEPPPAAFDEAVVPCTGIGVSWCYQAGDPEAPERVHSVLFQGKTRTAMCVFHRPARESHGNGLVFYDARVDREKFWGIPDAIFMTLDSAGKLHGSHEGRQVCVAQTQPQYDRAKELAHVLHARAASEIDRLWERHPELFITLQKSSFSLVVAEGERRVLLSLGDAANDELPRLSAEQVGEFLKRLGITSTFPFYGYEIPPAHSMVSSVEAPLDLARPRARKEIVSFYEQHGQPNFKDVLRTLESAFGVTLHVERGKGSHSMLLRKTAAGEVGCPIPASLCAIAERYPLPILWKTLKSLRIAEQDFLEALAR